MNPFVAHLGHVVGRAVCDQLPRQQSTRRILFVSFNTLIAGYLQEIFELLRDDPRLRFNQVLAKGSPAADRTNARRLLTCAEVSHYFAKVWHWDLVILADHMFETVCTPCTPWRFPVLRVPHGIGSKTVDGQDYQYGPGLYDPQGRLKYTRIFECSEARRAHFVARNPELAQVISVVGNLRADRLLAASAQRDELRRQMGFAPGHTVVLLTGSWGDDNLFRKVGPELMAEARRLLGKYQFIVRLHPNLLGPLCADRQDWQLFLEEQRKAGLRISPSEEDMMVPLVGCDVMVSDDLTALTLYAALLQKPLVCVRTGSKQSPADSFLGRLSRIVPELKRGRDLDATLTSTLHNWPPAHLAELAGEMNSYPAQARERILTEVYELLHLPRLDKPNTGAAGA